MKRKIEQIKLGTENSYQLETITCTYGTVISKNTKAFYINCGTWMNMGEYQPNELKHILFRFKKECIHYIRSITPELSPNALYSFVDVSVPEYLGMLTRQGFIGLEVTVHLNQPIENFKIDCELHQRIEDFCNKFEKKINNLTVNEHYKLSSRRVKNVGKIQREAV